MAADTRLLPTHLFDRRQLTTDPVELITYEVDAGFDHGHPDAVFFPESTDDVARVVRWAAAQRVPLVPRGAGTGLSGGAVAEQGGVIVEFARMNRILEIDRVGRSAVVEAGVVNLTLDTRMKEHGFYFPPDPSSGRSSVLGGNIAENAGGPHCFKYGVTTNYVTGLEVVLADGRVVTLGGQVLDPPGYELCGVMVGSEGTLGVITKAYVRLIRNPPGVKTLMASFDSEAQAGAAVSAVIAAGLVPATLEMMDQRVMRIIEAFVQVGLPVDAGAALIVEVDGYAAGLDAQLGEVVDILQANGGYDLRIAQDEQERQQIWYGRKSAAGAFSRLAPAFYLVDITVPRSRLAETLTGVNQVCDRHGLTVGHVFHAGDGNLHPAIVFDPKDAAMKERVLRACEEIVAICVAMGGSITGEHGVGIEKRAYMPMMYSGAELAAMQEVREVFDPQRLLNPGKILPDTLPPVERAAPVQPLSSPFAPASAQAAAAGLAALAASGTTVRIGSAADGNRLGADIWLSTAQLTGVHALAPEDLYVTVGAGTRLADLQARLAEHRLQVALASPWADASVGGLVAANVNGPQRMRYGAIRDILLASTVAMADGRVIRAGRAVVKNVAGYDLPKLLVGSHGTLGLLADVTLKVAPAPRGRRTLCVPLASLADGLQLARRLLPQALVASALVLVHQPVAPGMAAVDWALFYTAEGMVDDVDAELEAVARQCRGHGVLGLLETDVTGAGAWQTFLAGATPRDWVVRLGVPVKSLVETVTALPTAGQGDGQCRICVDCASGLAYAIKTADHVDEAARWLASLRTLAHARGGYVAVMAMPDDARAAIDPWGARPDGFHLMQKLKARWDPAGILNPGALLDM